MALKLEAFSVSGYRSLRDVPHLKVGALNAFVGGNGTGKTNLYRALQLAQAAATGTLSLEIAAEGGLGSSLWAGRRRRDEARELRLSVQLGSDGPAGYVYELGIGLPPSKEGLPTTGAFPLEPQVKHERLLLVGVGRPRPIMERAGHHGFAHDDDGVRHAFGTDILPTETALSSLQDAGRFGDVNVVRRTLAGWRFYHDLRTDRGSPMRHPCPGITATSLAPDGANLAAVMATLQYIRQDSRDLHAAVRSAFPGSRLLVPPPAEHATFSLELPGCDRPLAPQELSDGTLRYLALVAALLSYRRPPLLALNEPESSLHPELLAPLASLVASASRDGQVWLVTHSMELAGRVASLGGTEPTRVSKRDGETVLGGMDPEQVDDEESVI